MADRPTLVLSDIEDAMTTRVVDEGLAEFNEQQAGYVDARPLVVSIRDRDGATIGGLVGRTTLGLFFADLIYVPAELRGQGIGSQIMQMAEEAAVRRGCSAVVLFTIVFQAPDFYARLGYHELGRVECAPPGHTRVVMTKQLR